MKVTGEYVTGEYRIRSNSAIQLSERHRDQSSPRRCPLSVWNILCNYRRLFARVVKSCRSAIDGSTLKHCHCVRRTLIQHCYSVVAQF